MPVDLSPIARARALLVQKATEEPRFRRQLLSDPKAAVREMLGVDMPDSVRITVVEDDYQHLHIVLPPENRSEGELTDGELDSVSGGTTARKPIQQEIADLKKLAEELQKDAEQQ